METIYRLGLRFIGRIYVPERDSDFHVTMPTPRASPTAASLRVQHQLSPKGGSPAHSPSAQYLKEKRLKRRQSSMFSLPGEEELCTPLGSSGAHRLLYSASFAASSEGWGAVPLQLSGAVSQDGRPADTSLVRHAAGRNAASSSSAAVAVAGGQEGPSAQCSASKSDGSSL